MEENPYIKQFPELMAGKTIMYVHGFGSSAQSGTVKRIHETFPEARVIADDLPLHPAEAMDLLRSMCETESPDLIIGTSMGGMYTEMLYGYDRICVNPAFEMSETMHQHGMVGMQKWLNPRKDGEKEFLVTKQTVKEYAQMTEQCFSQVSPEEQRRVWGLFGDEDDVVNTFDLFRSHYPQAVHFQGGHRLTDKAFLHGVVPVVRWISDRQEGRQRPIVYVDASTLKDDYGHPKSSLQKAFDMLIEHYQVYLVCPSPTEDAGTMPAWDQWAFQTFGSAMWNHVIFCNQKALLYGDYFIDTSPDADFMGSTVAFGSDELKTWEDIIVYFSRLGGQ